MPPPGLVALRAKRPCVRLYRQRFQVNRRRFQASKRRPPGYQASAFLNGPPAWLNDPSACLNGASACLNGASACLNSPSARLIDSKFVVSKNFSFITSTRAWARDLSRSGSARAEGAQGTPFQSHISPSILEMLKGHLRIGMHHQVYFDIRR